MDRKYGPKYEKGLSVKDIAAHIRADVKAALATGKLPAGLKVSVTKNSYSGGASINVRVTGVPKGFPIKNPERDENEPLWRSPRYTPQMEAVLAVLREIHGAYNYNGSDSMTDYFDVRYYGSVNVDRELEHVEPAVPKVVA